MSTKYPALTTRNLIRRHRAIKFKGWRRWSEDAQILIGIGIPTTSSALYAGVGHEVGFLHNLFNLDHWVHLFPNFRAKQKLRKAANIFQRRLERATYRPNYFLPREYTKGFSNAQSNYQCKCLLGVCNRRNEFCLSDPQVGEAINGR